MYSKIKSIHIKNFKNLGNVSLDFTKSPIIALKGNNDAGKSSIIDAFAVCAYNAYETHQKDFIKLGTTGFGVMIELEDGTKVTRIKKTNLNFYQVEYPDGRVWNTDKLIRGEDIPTPVEQALGCIKESETKSFLHIRTYNDQMLFINTPSSTNYKVMYGALKVENISQAIRRGSTEANEIKNWLNNASVQRETLINTLNGIQILDIEPVVATRDRLKKSVRLLEKLARAKGLHDTIVSDTEKLGQYKELQQSGLTDINVGLARLLVDTARAYNEYNECTDKLSKFKGLDSISEVKADRLTKMQEVISRVQGIQSKLTELQRYKSLEQISDINITVYEKIADVVTRRERLSELSGKVSTIQEVVALGEITSSAIVQKLEQCQHLIAKEKETEQQRKEQEDIMNTVKSELKVLGVQMVTCDKCGNDVVVMPDSEVSHCE